MNTIIHFINILFFFTLVNASNYDNYIQQVEGRSRMVHDSFAEIPGVRERMYDTLSHIHQDDSGVVNALHESSTDDEISSYWNDLLQNLQNIREDKSEELRDHLDKWNTDSEEGIIDEDQDDGGSDSESQAVIKSDEIPYKNHLWGEHRVSGGTGKQTPNSGIKTDMLPGYCDPPNPCPKGVDPKKLTSPCDHNIPNTKAFNKEWIWKKMQNGECSCDVDHMEICPRQIKKTDSKKNDRNLPNMLSNAMLDSEIINHAVKKGNPYLASSRHQAVEKKAGPI